MDATIEKIFWKEFWFKTGISYPSRTPSELQEWLSFPIPIPETVDTHLSMADMMQVALAVHGINTND